MYKVVNLGAIPTFDNLPPLIPTAPSAPQGPVVKPPGSTHTPKRKCVTRVVSSAGKVTKIVDCRCAPVIVRMPGMAPAVRWVCPTLPPTPATPTCPPGQTWVSSPFILNVPTKAPKTSSTNAKAMAGFGITAAASKITYATPSTPTAFPGKCVLTPPPPPSTASGADNEEVPEEQVQIVDNNQVPDVGSVVTDTGAGDSVVSPPDAESTAMVSTTFLGKYKQQLMFGAALVGGFALINKILR